VELLLVGADIYKRAETERHEKRSVILEGEVIPLGTMTHEELSHVQDTYDTKGEQ
jgi:hypothetical protein